MQRGCSLRLRFRLPQIAGAAFLLGAGLTAGAQSLPMLVCGRISLGVGVGFANQARA